MRGMQSDADPDRPALEPTGRNHQSPFCRFWGAVRSPVACSQWVDGVLRLRLLEKDRPGFGPRVAHWADRVSRLRLLAKDRPGSDLLVANWPQNDAYPHLAPGQNETLRERANSADNATSSVVVGVVISVKILSIK